MKYVLIFLLIIPSLTIAAIDKKEYRRRIDNIYRLDKVLIEKEIEFEDVGKFASFAVQSLDEALLHDLEVTGEEIKQDELADKLDYKEKIKTIRYLKKLKKINIEDPAKHADILKAIIKLLK